MWNYFFDFSQPAQLQMPKLHFVEFSRSRNGQARPYHVHTEYHIMFCVKGKACLRISDAELDMTPGRIAVIPPDTLHSCTTLEEGLDFWGISFSASEPEDELSRFFSSCGALSADFSGYLDYVQGAFHFVHESADRLKGAEPPTPTQRLAADRFIRSQTLALLCFVQSMLSYRPYPQERSDLPMEEIIRWMMEHYAENITLDSLSERFALSSSHFSRRFQEAFHISPINYLIDYRIDVAKDLLIYTDKPIAQIAAEVGYANPYHFSSLFSRRTGLTPQQMRSHCRDAETQPYALPELGDFDGD